MPSSLIIVALVVAWLLVLVPIVARKRQEVARTADSTLAARVVHSGGVHATVPEEASMPDADTAQAECLGPDLDEVDFDEDFDESLDEGVDEDFDDDLDGGFDRDELEFDEERLEDIDLDEPYADDDADAPMAHATSADSRDDYEYLDEAEYDEEYPPARPYRPGRGGFDPEAAAAAARAKYAFRQRIVLLTLVVAIATAVAAVLVNHLVWWLHGAVDLTLVGYLTYLRRQVRIEEEIRQRRTARLGPPPAARAPAASAPDSAVHDEAGDEPHRAPARPAPRLPSRPPMPGTVVVDMDDDDPVFDELAEPDELPYRRAVGE